MKPLFYEPHKISAISALIHRVFTLTEKPLIKNELNHLIHVLQHKNNYPVELV